MNKTIAIISLIWLPLVLQLNAQSQDDPILFTVENTQVPLSEFLYIFNKTSGITPDYSRKSLEEYLDLYINFKLKVRKAKELQLDTLPDLAEELNGYRRQLADSYLIDKEVTEKLLSEAYNRIQYDVDISHIVFGIQDNQIEAAFEKARQLRKKLTNKTDFEEAASEFSEDPSSKNNKGRIGFVTAPFPPGFYELENQAYQLAEGTISEPIVSDQGVHLLMVNGKRPARGQIEVAHILIRKNSQYANPEEKIKEIKTQLDQGLSFSDAASKYSEDNGTSQRGGYLGIFGINKYELPFENAAFELSSDGDFSDPFESSLGWHIIKRISKRNIQNYDVEKGRLQAQLIKDPRYELAKLALIEKIKQEGDLKESKQILDQFSKTLEADFLTYKWRVPEPKSTEILFTLKNNFTVSLGDFTEFLYKSSRQRIGMGEDTPLDWALNELYQEFLSGECMRYEEKNLELKYPEFASLLREYEEGILLFEVTKLMVWDKAAQDTLGLSQFYEAHKHKYFTEEKATAEVFRILPSAATKLNEIINFASQNTSVETLQKYNSNGIVVAVEQKTFNKSELLKEFSAQEWKIGTCTRPRSTSDGTALTFLKIIDIEPEGYQSIKEARGYIVADYQDYLDKNWIEELRNSYTFSINFPILEKIIEK
jgi:peptidyl-prolyl cis-trans isomerase SurA